MLCGYPVCMSAIECTAPVRGHETRKGQYGLENCPACSPKKARVAAVPAAASAAPPPVAVKRKYYDDHAGDEDEESNWDGTEDWQHAGDLNAQAKAYIERWPVPGPEYGESDREIWLAQFRDASDEDPQDSLRALKKAATDGPGESIPVVLCGDCANHQENESPNPMYSSNSSCEDCHEAGVECNHDGHATEDFSSSGCGECSTTMAGERHHYAYRPDEDPNATVTEADVFATAPAGGQDEEVPVTWLSGPRSERGY